MNILRCFLVCSACHRAIACDAILNCNSNQPIDVAVSNSLKSVNHGDEIDINLLYHNYPAKSLETILIEPNIHRAVMAQWKIAISSQSVKQVSKQNLQSIPGEKIQRFVGFVEGRLHINLPEWWEEIANSATSSGIDRSISVEVKKNPNWRADKKSGLILHENLESAIASNLRLDVLLKNSLEQFQLDFSQEIPTKFLLDNSSTCVNISKQDALYVTIHSSMGQRYKISKHNLLDGKLLWSSFVWTMPAPPGGGSGISRHGHFSEILFTDEVVYVVGATPGGQQGVIYIEGFNRLNGDPLIRFSSEY